ncbi:MAG: ATP-dependent protease ATPase subunit HslU [Sphaerochaetaceae bacterium]
MELITSNKSLDDMFPSEIVKELDKYVIGQTKAKRTISVALRNRTRRKRLPEDIRDEVYPKNIIMIGPTGVGKTEIARRIAKLSNAPFVKVEATKYTEVGYVGRDVESMVRDLMGVAISGVKKEMAESNAELVKTRVEDRLLDLLIPNMKPAQAPGQGADGFDGKVETTRESYRMLLRSGALDDKEVEMTPAPAKPAGIGIELMTSGNPSDMNDAVNSLGSIFGNLGRPPRKRKVTVKRAREILTDEESEKVVDQDRMVDLAKERTEQMGIIFIDEIDKIAGSNSNSGSPDISREGVQRDILPIVEGTKVNTKWGVIDTSHILFIAAGAFHVSKPSDLIPELQGRFPLRVELSALTVEDFVKILTEPANAITVQYKELMKTEGVDLEFSPEGIRRIAEIAFEVNTSNENIGARRLYTIMETLLEELAFSANELSGQKIVITPEYVDQRLSDVVKDQDLSQYIL